MSLQFFAISASNWANFSLKTFRTTFVGFEVELLLNPFTLKETILIVPFYTYIYKNLTHLTRQYANR